MSKLKVTDIADCVTMLVEIEFQAVMDLIAKAKKDKEEDSVLMGQSYIMGLKRCVDIINNVLKDVKDE